MTKYTNGVPKEAKPLFSDDLEKGSLVVLKAVKVGEKVVFACEFPFIEYLTDYRGLTTRVARCIDAKHPTIREGELWVGTVASAELKEWSIFKNKKEYRVVQINVRDMQRVEMHCMYFSNDSICLDIMSGSALIGRESIPAKKEILFRAPESKPGEIHKIANIIVAGRIVRRDDEGTELNELQKKLLPFNKENFTDGQFRMFGRWLLSFEEMKQLIANVGQRKTRPQGQAEMSAAI